MSVDFLLLQTTFSVLAFAGMHRTGTAAQFEKRFQRFKSPLPSVHNRLSKDTTSMLSSIAFVWGASWLLHHTILPQHSAVLLWFLAIGNLLRVVFQTWRFQLNSAQEEPLEVQRRLIQLQFQLQKLHEKEALGAQLVKTNQSQATLDRYGEHFKRVLINIENHLIYGEHEHAELVITLFSRHLRQLLHEGSSPFLSLENSIEHIKTHLELMAVLTGQRFICDVDDDMLDAHTLKRHTERFQLGPWVEERVWPFFSLAERSLQPMQPMTLLIDIEGNKVVLTFSDHDLHESRTIPQAQFRLLGSPSSGLVEREYSESMRVT